MSNWPNTIQCLGSDDIVSLGIKSSAVFWFHYPKTESLVGGWRVGLQDATICHPLKTKDPEASKINETTF